VITRIMAALAVFGVIASMLLLPLGLRSTSPTAQPVRNVGEVSAPHNPVQHIDQRLAAPRPVTHHVVRAVKTVHTWTVRAGQTLWSIAHSTGESWQRLYHANRTVIGSNPNIIRTGERLIL
jgi:nucleoid-associated protein YgaU